MSQRYMYLRDYSKSNKHPVGCLVVELNREDKQIKYAYSVCSPADPWDRIVAKNKALGRLIKKPSVIDGEIPTSTHAVTRLIMQHIMDNNKSQPKRSQLAYLASSMWLDLKETAEVLEQ